MARPARQQSSKAEERFYLFGEVTNPAKADEGGDQPYPFLRLEMWSHLVDDTLDMRCLSPLAWR
jgi:hypothetical protein